MSGSTNFICGNLSIKLKKLFNTNHLPATLNAFSNHWTAIAVAYGNK